MLNGLFNEEVGVGLRGFGDVWGGYCVACLARCLMMGGAFGGWTRTWGFDEMPGVESGLLNVWWVVELLMGVWEYDARVGNFIGTWALKRAFRSWMGDANKLFK